MEQDEQIIWRGHSSHVINLGTFILCGLLCWLIVPLFIALWKWLENRNRVYEVTTERIKIRHGVFNKLMDELELYRVKDTSLEEPFFLRMFNLGTIVLTTTDDSSPLCRIEAVSEASDLREKLRKAVEACRLRRGVRVAELE